MYYQFKLADYTSQDIVAFSRVITKLYRRSSQAAYLFLGLAMLALGFPILFGRRSLVGGSLLLILGLFNVCVFIFYHQLTALRARRMMPANRPECTVTLDDTGVRMTAGGTESFVPYRNFINCVHAYGRYYFLEDQKHGIILPETAITVGDPAALAADLSKNILIWEIQTPAQ